MLFHRWIFLVFLLVVLPVFFALRRTRFWLPWLLAASYFFYAWWNPLYLLLVIYSTVLDYLLVTLMDHSPRGPSAIPVGSAPRTVSASSVQMVRGADPTESNASAPAAGQNLKRDTGVSLVPETLGKEPAPISPVPVSTVHARPGRACHDEVQMVRGADPTESNASAPAADGDLKGDTGVSPVPEPLGKEPAPISPVPVSTEHARPGRACHDEAFTPSVPDSLLRFAFYAVASLAILLILAATIGPHQRRPTLIAFSILVALMAVGARVANRFIWLLISLFNNLALLLFFKYARFVGVNLNQLAHWLGSSFRFADPSTLMPPKWEYLLPVGISFFTFQSMSYTIDFYLGKVPRERNILRFATFVCFFPQLMAGPIERARQMLPQLQKAPAFRLENLTDGMSLFLVGLFKKLALADYLALYVDRVYDNPTLFKGSALALATFAFAWQIFFDFSGYTDMARGVAKMMGFSLVLNFNNPYLATSLGDFWTRWHISLSTWFRDYVYIPLGGNRRGPLATYRNLLVTFVISGIWHGANWSFAIWGALHAVGVMVTRELERSSFYRERIPKLFKRTWVFLYVCFAWIFFRAASLSDALLIVRRIFATTWRSPQIPALMLGLIATVWLYQATYESPLRGILRFSPLRVALAAAMILYLGFCSVRGGAFIYFQF